MLVAFPRGGANAHVYPFKLALDASGGYLYVSCKQSPVFDKSGPSYPTFDSRIFKVCLGCVPSPSPPPPPPPSPPPPPPPTTTPSPLSGVAAGGGGLTDDEVAVAAGFGAVLGSASVLALINIARSAVAHFSANPHKGEGPEAVEKAALGASWSIARCCCRCCCLLGACRRRRSEEDEEDEEAWIIARPTGEEGGGAGAMHMHAPPLLQPPSPALAPAPARAPAQCALTRRLTPNDACRHQGQDQLSRRDSPDDAHGANAPHAAGANPADAADASPADAAGAHCATAPDGSRGDV